MDCSINAIAIYGSRNRHRSNVKSDLEIVVEYDGEERVPDNVAEYAQAYRLRRFLGYFKQISANAIPPTSLLREFLVGSSFKY